jgi:hypothetical protein
MAVGFGADASEWAQRLSHGVDLIAADMSRGAAALAHVRDFKLAGRPVAATVLVPDLRTKIATALAPRLLGHAADPDERITLFGALTAGAIQIDGVEQANYVRYDPVAINGARDFLMSADVCVVRSSLETERIAAVIGFCADSIVVAAPLDPRVPSPCAGTATRDRIVVWAPYQSPAECSLVAQGLDALRLPVTIVCAPGPIPNFGLRAEFVPPDAGPAVLARALLIIDATLDDPGTTRALAAHGVPLATAWTSGAHEWLRPVYPYMPWDARGIFNAAITALGGRAARPAHADDGVSAIAAELRSVSASLLREGPLVSIVIPTYNRRDLLPRAIGSVASQLYRSVEIVVVNDGGSDVSDIVAAFPAARLINQERNAGVMPALNAGIAAARGEYIGLLADDDFLYSDHVSRMVAALERNAFALAHATELVRHAGTGTAESPAIRGHHIGSPRPTFPADILVNNHICGPGAMYRRSVFEQHGFFDQRVHLGADFDMWMRLISCFDFGYVNRVTVEVSMRPQDPTQISNFSGADSAKLLAEIYGRHPVAGRPLLERRRAEQIAFIAAQEVFRAYPTVLLDANDLRELDAVPAPNGSH